MWAKLHETEAAAGVSGIMAGQLVQASCYGPQPAHSLQQREPEQCQSSALRPFVVPD